MKNPLWRADLFKFMSWAPLPTVAPKCLRDWRMVKITLGLIFSFKQRNVISSKVTILFPFPNPYRHIPEVLPSPISEASKWLFFFFLLFTKEQKPGRNQLCCILNPCELSMFCLFSFPAVSVWRPIRRRVSWGAVHRLPRLPKHSPPRDGGKPQQGLGAPAQTLGASVGA